MRLAASLAYPRPTASAGSRGTHNNGIARPSYWYGLAVLQEMGQGADPEPYPTGGAAIGGCAPLGPNAAAIEIPHEGPWHREVPIFRHDPGCWPGLRKETRARFR